MPFHHGTQTLKITAALAAAMLIGFSGCSMCCAPFDYDFGYTGGAWMRDNPSSGRVGSVFEPAGYKAIEDRPNSAPTSIPEDVPTETPRSNRSNMDEFMPPPPAENPDPGSISTPRLRATRNYLPET